MLNSGDRVKIINTDSVFDGKEGILEQVLQDEDSTMCTVFVDFLPEEGKKIRQNFDIANVEFLTEGKNKNKNNKGNNQNKGNNNTQQVQNYDLSSLKNLEDVIPELENSYKKHIYVSNYFDNYLDKLKSKTLKQHNNYLKYVSLLDRALKSLNDMCSFGGNTHTEIVQGLTPFYKGKLKELDVGSIDNNQVRFIWFKAGDNIVLTSSFIHKQPSLTQQEAESGNRCFDSVFRPQTKKY